MQVAAWVGMSESDTILAVLPIFHGFGLGVARQRRAHERREGRSWCPQFSAEIVAKLMRDEAARR